MEKESGMPKVILVHDNTCIALAVGPFEASAIIVELEGIQPPRPLTHDLLSELFVRHHFSLKRIEIYGRLDDRNLARIHYSKGMRKYSMETRPSDAIALAVRLDAPILVDEACIPALIFLQQNNDANDHLDFLYLENQHLNSQVM